MTQFAVSGQPSSTVHERGAYKQKRPHSTTQLEEMTIVEKLHQGNPLVNIMEF